MGRLRLEAKEKELLAKGLVKAVRENLDPFEKIEGLNGELIASQALELAEVQIQYQALLAEIAAIEKALKGM